MKNSPFSILDGRQKSKMAATKFSFLTFSLYDFLKVIRLKEQKKTSLKCPEPERKYGNDFKTEKTMNYSIYLHDSWSKMSFTFIYIFQRAVTHSKIVRLTRFCFLQVQNIPTKFFCSLSLIAL